MLAGFGLGLMVCCVVLSILPSIVAFIKDHTSKYAIFLLNISTLIIGFFVAGGGSATIEDPIESYQFILNTIYATMFIVTGLTVWSFITNKTA